MPGIERIPPILGHHTTALWQSQGLPVSPFDSRCKGGYKKELVNDSIPPFGAIMSAETSILFNGLPVSEDVIRAASAVRFLVLDVDGVCTDGKLYFQENGHPLKCFNAQDGIGIKTALMAGIGIGIITGRNDPCVLARMSQLGVRDYYAGFESKLPKLEAIRRKYHLRKEEMAYLGDDWIDLDPMRSVGMPMAVANAVAQVKKEALYVTSARGGEGAVREAVEFLLASRRDGKNPADLWTAATGPARA